MDRKILVGSIIAVAILVGVSLTSVVGFQSIKSINIAETSPLFNIRTNRAIGEESKILTSNYVGRGNTLPFPKRDDITVIIQKVVDTIRLMDDETFERFIAYLINQMQKDNKFKVKNPDEIREAFNLFRNSNAPLTNIGEKIKNNQNNRFQTFPVTVCCKTEGLCPFTLNGGKEGIYNCIYILITAPFLIMLEVVDLLYNFLVKFPTIPLGICISINC